MLLMAMTAAQAQSGGVNGPRTDQKQGTSSYISGNDGRGGTTIGGVGISRQQDIRRTSSGTLHFSPQKIAALKTAAKKANLQRRQSVAFTVAVGAAVPRQADAHDLPPSLQAILPSGNTMNYILVQRQLILVDKNTARIVAIIPNIG
jgi:hypothetical protein